MPNKVNSTPGEVETVRPKRCIWRTIDIPDGLPGSVLCIHQDRRGYIWFGTPGGLCRYDGAEFLTYTTEDGLAVNLENISVNLGNIRIHEDRHGRLWVYNPRKATAKGVSCVVYPERGQGDKPYIQTYTTQDGLPPGGVTDLHEDQQGRLWFCTSHGASMFDGERFVTYTTDDRSESNQDQWIRSDSKGRVFLGTADGVSTFDGRGFTTLATEKVLRSWWLWVEPLIHSDRQGRLWLCTEGGVLVFDGQTFTRLTTADGLAANTIGAIHEDDHGRLWFATAHGVSCYDDGKISTMTTADGLARNDVRGIHSDRQGRLWFYGGGISMFDGEGFTVYTTADGLARNDPGIGSIYADRQGNVWFSFGLDGGGVSMFDGEGFTTYNVEDGLLTNRVSNFWEDREGHLWLIHEHSGLTVIHLETLELLTDKPIILGTPQTSGGELWFLSENQLCSLRSPTTSSYGSLRSPTASPYGCLSSGQLRCHNFNHLPPCLLIDSKGALWVGTAGGGLYHYETASAVWQGEGKRFTKADGLGSNSIWGLLETRDGTIWASTPAHPTNHLCRYDGEGSFEAIPVPRGGLMETLMEDRLGRIWFGGWMGGGLSCYDGEGITTYTIADGLPSDTIRSLTEDDAGRLWIGTLQGLCCFDGQSFIHYGKEHLLKDLVHNISSTKDRNGQLWFSTSGGVYRYDGKHFQQLTTEDGLPANQVWGLLPQPDGSMIIGTARGIVRYRPTATTPPPIEIREVVADRVYRNPTALELTATKGQPGRLSLLTISYHGMSFATQKMRYSCILEGYDAEWHDTWENHARYENLPVSEYTFKVIAINRDLVPSEAPATLKLTVIPDPRNHQIAQLESDLEKRNQELEQANAELTRLSQFKSELLSVVSHELRTPLTSIDGFTRLIHERFLTEDFIAQCNDAMRPTIQRVKDRVQIIRENTSRLARLINDLLDFSRIERGRELEMHFIRLDLSDVIESVMATYQAPAAEKGLTLHYAGEVPLHSGALEVLGDPDRLTQVLSNLVSNAIKFTPEGGVITLGARKAVGQTVSLSTPGAGKVELTVQDTGVGIPQEQLATLFEPFEQAGTTETKKGGTGLGLAIVKSIVERHEGTVRVESEVGVGSTFIVALPEYVAEAPARTTPQRILIVDDDYDILRLLEEGLSAYPNTRIITAGKSQDAFTILSTQPCDVMITDVRMPGDISGIELARQVQEKYPALKVFVMTNTPEEKARVVQLHSDWIDKAMPNLIHYIAKKIGRE